jgi:hypothetical protein
VFGLDLRDFLVGLFHNVLVLFEQRLVGHNFALEVDCLLGERLFY